MVDRVGEDSEEMSGHRYVVWRDHLCGQSDCERCHLCGDIRFSGDWDIEIIGKFNLRSGSYVLTTVVLYPMGWWLNIWTISACFLEIRQTSFSSASIRYKAVWYSLFDGERPWILFRQYFGSPLCPALGRLILSHEVGPNELQLVVVCLGPDVSQDDGIADAVAGELGGGRFALDTDAVDSVGGDVLVRNVVKVAKRHWRDRAVRDVEFEMHGHSRVHVQDLNVSRCQAGLLTLKTPSKN
jgi:hypothetical protein